MSYRQSRPASRYSAAATPTEGPLPIDLPDSLLPEQHVPSVTWGDVFAIVASFAGTMFAIGFFS
ncbi:MAG TPA: hypothetical protein VKB96_11130 [Gammaproteobacteria bacterium]|nr:hypothetical protein [Gammaproteobacteria bacterium]